MFRSPSVVILEICSYKFSFCISILSDKLNIFNSERMSPLVFDPGECTQLLEGGTSFQHTLFSFRLMDLFLVFFGIANTLYEFICVRYRVGAHGIIVGWDTILRSWRPRFQFPMRSLDIFFFNLPNPSSRTMTLGSTQPLTEMSARNLPGGKRRPAHKADNLNAICESIV
jgi:hypothetical protein